VLGRQKRLVMLESSRYNVKAEWVTIYGKPQLITVMLDVKYIASWWRMAGLAPDLWFHP